MDNKERSNILKQIWRETRSQLRKYRTVQIEKRLQAFSGQGSRVKGPIESNKGRGP